MVAQDAMSSGCLENTFFVQAISANPKSPFLSYFFACEVKVFLCTTFSALFLFTSFRLYCIFTDEQQYQQLYNCTFMCTSAFCMSIEFSRNVFHFHLHHPFPSTKPSSVYFQLEEIYCKSMNWIAIAHRAPSSFPPLPPPPPLSSRFYCGHRRRLCNNSKKQIMYTCMFSNSTFLHFAAG